MPIGPGMNQDAAAETVDPTRSVASTPVTAVLTRTTPGAAGSDTISYRSLSS